MFNKNFYPTPEHVIAKMLCHVEHTHGSLSCLNILEPSAGKGDICDFLMKKSDNLAIHCIEKEPDLQATLIGKGYPVVHDDFLTFSPDEHYDLIMMNPPFEAGEKHLLHAWEIIQYGQIVCLLNSETLNNPHTSARMALNSIIEKHGKVQSLGACFQTAERKTGVDVSLVYLKKERQEAKYTLFEDLETDFKEEYKEDDHGQQVATKNTIGNLVLCFERSMALYDEIAPRMHELSFYLNQLSAGDAMKAIAKSSCEQAGALYAVEDRDRKFRHNPQASFTKALKEKSWAKVIEMTSAKNFMSDGVKKSFQQQQKIMEACAFSEKNIKNFIFNLHDNQEEILRQCVVEAFELMTSFDQKNKVHHEGWKTNDAWKVNRKVIVPVALWGDKEWFESSGRMSYGYTDKLDDVDRAMCYIVGKKFENVLTVARATKEAAKVPGWTGEIYESEFFSIRAYKKGTIHMTFKDVHLWERFNLIAADGKNWLPDDYKNHKDLKLLAIAE